MRKLTWILIFVLGFFIIFAASAAITFTITLNKNEAPSEAVTDAVLSETPNVPAQTLVEGETPVTRVVPALSAGETVIERTVYKKQEEVPSEVSVVPEEVAF